MSEYERLYRRPAPSDYQEVMICVGCGKPQPRAIDCPAGADVRLVRKDGRKLTLAEYDALYGARRD